MRISGPQLIFPQDLSGMAQLRRLTLTSVKSANLSVDLAPLATLPALYEIEVSNPPSQRNPWLWNLNQLTDITWTGPFFGFDPQISNLQNLTSLDIDSDTTDGFPPEIGTLQLLKTFRMRCTNGPTSFPSFLTNLAALETIILQGFNSISIGTFPPLSLFPQLTKFSVSFLPVTFLPSFVGADNLLSVTIVSLSQLATFPSVPATGLPKLESVYLADCPLLTGNLPTALFNSATLKTIAVVGIPFSGVMPALSNLVNLNILSLLGLSVSGAFPPLGQLRNLTSLTIGSCLGLQGAIDAPLGLPLLENLDISGTKISAINIGPSPALRSMCVAPETPCSSQPATDHLHAALLLSTTFRVFLHRFSPWNLSPASCGGGI
jgi:Leucine-rich repeat (LRR) protein